MELIIPQAKSCQLWETGHSEPLTPLSSTHRFHRAAQACSLAILEVAPVLAWALLRVPLIHRSCDRTWGGRVGARAM